MYDGKTYAALKKAFKIAVDDYLAACKKLRKEPQKTYSGNLNIRIDPAVHAKAARAAQTQGITLNEYIKQTIEIRTASAETEQAGLLEQYFTQKAIPTLVGHSSAVTATVSGHTGTTTASTGTLH